MGPSSVSRSEDINQLLQVKEAVDVLMANAQLTLDDSVVELRNKLLATESKQASATLLRFYQSNRSRQQDSSEEFGSTLRQIAQDCLTINNSRIGLLRGSLSPLSIGKDIPTPSGVADFYDRMQETKKKVEALIATA
jgi:hypothetical protein